MTKRERKPMRERIGWAVVNSSGAIIGMSPYGKRSTIRECMDNLGAVDREKEWKDCLKRGIRCIKVRITPVEKE